MPFGRPSIGNAPPSFADNATLSKHAENQTQSARQATAATTVGGKGAHQAAADAHNAAADAHAAAGNATRAAKHKGVAMVHQEKADAENRSDWNAKDEARAAETLSQKAEKSRFGQDPQDPRDSGQLHNDAADAHERAAHAHEAAGDEPGMKYHLMKAGAHRGAANEIAQAKPPTA